MLLKPNFSLHLTKKLAEKFHILKHTIFENAAQLNIGLRKNASIQVDLCQLHYLLVFVIFLLGLSNE